MAPRSRALAFGSATAVVVAGVACGLLVGGLAGQVLLIALTTAGLGGALLLAFLEVGLSEEHQRERDARRRRKVAGRAPQRHRLPRRPRR
jgi:hypothetical protein